MATRGAVGVVVDGGVYKSFQCESGSCPIYSRFVSPSPAINRKETEAIGRAVSIGGVVVKPGEIIMGDEDGMFLPPFSP